ncbi:MAG: FeoB-associated Cys-rich membrane protein [Clostridia bacterium]|nr:FeoB-associated Cys-rich membrane protein [Clostridia bacterium]
MEDIIIIAIVILIVVPAGAYVYREKKNGKKCIGCPEGGKCTSGDCENCRIGK